MSDEDLARQVAHGEREAFAELYDRHHQALYRYGRSILRDPDQAQDALQSAMASAFAALRAGERDLAVRPWLFRIVHNEAISLLRKRRGLDVEAQETALAASEDRAPQRALEQRERLSSLLVDLQALSERQRSALLMRELSGLAIGEIAAALSITPTTAKQTIFEARSALREMAEGRASDCDSIRQLIDEQDRRVLRGRGVRSHLRACVACREYEQEIATRSADLRALAPPLPAVAASAMLTRLLAGSASPHAAGAAAAAGSGAAAAGGSGTVASGAGAGAGAGSAVGVGSGLGAATSVKALAAIALVLAGGAGATHLALSGSGGGRAVTHRRVPRPSPAVVTPSARQSIRIDHAQPPLRGRSGAAGARHSQARLLASRRYEGAADRQALRSSGAAEHFSFQERRARRGNGAGGEGHRQTARSPNANANSHGAGSHHAGSTNGRGEGPGRATGEAAPGRTPHGAAGKAPPGHAKGNPQGEGAGGSEEGAGAQPASQQAPGRSQHGGSQAP